MIRKYLLILVITLFVTLFALPDIICFAQKEVSLEDKYEKINYTEWDIIIVPANQESKERKKEDTISFKDGKFYSKIYRKEGSPPLNYTIEDKGSKKIYWMISHRGEETVSYWKGERQNKENMKGFITTRYLEGDDAGKTVDYTFKSTEMRKLPRPITPTLTADEEIETESEVIEDEDAIEIPEEEVVVKEPVVEVPQEEVIDEGIEKKEEKGWWRR